LLLCCVLCLLLLVILLLLLRCCCSAWQPCIHCGMLALCIVFMLFCVEG
jgi:hypothetical protein